MASVYKVSRGTTFTHDGGELLGEFSDTIIATAEKTITVPTIDILRFVGELQRRKEIERLRTADPLDLLDLDDDEDDEDYG